MYPCTKCNHNFTTKQGLQKHEERKVSCTVETEKEKTCECKYCHKMFRFASNRYKHYKCCKMKPQEEAKEESVDDESMDDDEILALVKSFKLKKNELKQRLMSPTTITNNTTNNISDSNNTTINILINDFGNENLERITDEFLHKCFKNYKKQGIQMLTKHVHFNDEYPEDKNIRRGSITNKTLKIRQNGQWTPASKNSVMDKVISDKLWHLNKYFIEHHEQVGEVEAELFTKWYHAVREKRGEDFFNIRNELFVYASTK